MTSAWCGDWYGRIEERARERGFDTVTAFADSQPRAPLLALSDELGKDVAASQIEKVLIDEAEEAGTLERCARSLLVRRLNEKIPEGWRKEWDDSTLGSGYRLASAYADWCAALPSRYQESYHRIGDALKVASIPEGWLPAGPDDPILVELFRQHWDTPE